MLMHQLVVDGASRHPDRIAFRWVDRARTLTYAEAVRDMERLAGGLAELGVVKGDRVSVVAHNGMDYLVAMLAAWRIGAIAALVNVKFADELDYYFSDHTPKVVIYTHDLEPAVKRGAKAAGSVEHLICMDGPQEGAKALGEIMSAGLPPPPDPMDESAVAHLSYTSGTTGKPKGACLMHEPTVRAAHCIGERLQVGGEDMSFGPTALSSSYQLVANLLPPLAAGATINVMGRWTPATGYDAIEATGATFLVGNPTLLSETLQQSRERGRVPGRLRFVLSGGGPVPLALKRAWRDELKVPLVESYGQSELGGFVGLGFPRLESDERLAAVGPPLPDKEVRVFDGEDKELPAGAVGELCLRGGFMAGYWGRPEATAKALRNGWLHTGDAGLVDRDRFVTMRGRFSELLNVGGKTWYPRDIEDALCEEAAIAEAAVVGVGGKAVACVRLRPGASLDAPGTVERVGARLPYDLAQLELRVLEAFPMTPTGKIAKAELASLLGKG
jgi:acyl-coenzyme A synthetase/AMP-(fatty) acid ligase